MEKVTESDAALQAKDAASQQVEEENAQMRERESSLKQQLATAEEKARIGAELEQQLLDERKKQKIMGAKHAPKKIRTRKKCPRRGAPVGKSCAIAGSGRVSRYMKWRRTTAKLN